LKLHIKSQAAMFGIFFVLWQFVFGKKPKTTTLSVISFSRASKKDATTILIAN
tara:strand:- start:13542 stop:13700 length:159 start_codon:yes stop_codon:yes gene_type:complete